MHFIFEGYFLFTYILYKGNFTSKSQISLIHFHEFLLLQLVFHFLFPSNHLSNYSLYTAYFLAIVHFYAFLRNFINCYKQIRLLPYYELITSILLFPRYIKTLYSQYFSMHIITFIIIFRVLVTVI